MSKYILTPLDVETGGLDTDRHSLLTLYICSLDEDLNVVSELDLKLKPDDGNYVVDQGALDVNKINLEEHDKDPNTVTYSEGKVKFLEFAKQVSKSKRILSPAGHNILGFDVPMIMNALKISKEEWDKVFHYKIVDTLPIVTVLQKAGWLPEELVSQDSLVKYYNVTKRTAHVAKNDTLMWVEIYQNIIKSLKQVKNAGSNSDELLILE